MKNKILVTGSEGFIGSHLVEKLVKEGFNIKALVYYNSFNSWGWLEHADNKIKKEIRVITGDIRDEFLIKNQLKKNVDVVINLAALIGIPYSYRAPKSYFDTKTYDHPHFYWEDEAKLTDAPLEDLEIARLPDAPNGTRITSVNVVIRLKNEIS